MSPGAIYVVGTPIGNLEDITLRALKLLAQVAVVAAEDTRVTARLLQRHGIRTPLVSFREQNAARAIPALIARLEAGEEVALVTDAGTPSVSDPGALLVAAAAKAGIPVVPLPGPSALGAAISVSGFTGDGVRFFGFLPRKGPERREKLRLIASEKAVSVIYESPARLGKTLAELAESAPGRQAVVCRELTKLHEEIARGTLDELAARFAGEVRGEVAIVVSGAKRDADPGISDERIAEIIREKLEAGLPVKEISVTLAGALGVPRKKIYDMAIRELSAVSRE